MSKIESAPDNGEQPCQRSARNTAARIAVVLLSIVPLCISCSGPKQPPAVSPKVESDVSAVAHELPPLPDSPFLNTRKATYVGSDVCIACHDDEYHSFKLTGMGRSLDVADPNVEPPDVQFDHALSNRRYEVYRQDGRLFHRELVLTEKDAEPVVLTDVEVPWVVGSGRHSRSYLVEIDGFLVESPLTWYTQREAWGMSPGYDRPNQQGFQRAVDETCLTCHAGQAKPKDGSLHRMAIHEAWISCERCHGPGSIHVDRWEKGIEPPNAGTDEIDYTIVNQVHLDRDLSDAICAQCHLRSSATSAVRGRGVSDFRPGLPLSAYRADYRLDNADVAMTVVGHVEQLWMSRCYQASQLSCTTCHNPHGFPSEEERVAYYRSKCFECHAQNDCRVEPSVRERESPANDCVQCHMPKTDTDIPHFAFTHHRIGFHDKSETTGAVITTAVSKQPGKLRCLMDVSGYSDADQKRMLGMGYLELSRSEHGAGHHRAYQMMAWNLLREVWDSGMRDAELAGNLAAIASMVGSPNLPDFAEAALNASDASPRTQVNAHLAMANWYVDREQYDAAAASLRELVKLRRFSADWELLGEVEQRRNNWPDAIADLEEALEIDPANSHLRSWLIGHYQGKGNRDRAEWHRQRLLPERDIR